MRKALTIFTILSVLLSVLACTHSFDFKKPFFKNSSISTTNSSQSNAQSQPESESGAEHNGHYCLAHSFFLIPTIPRIVDLGSRDNYFSLNAKIVLFDFTVSPFRPPIS